MTAIRWMKSFCLVCVGFFLVGAVIHSLTMGSFKSLNHLSKNPNPERLPKELVKDVGDFIDRSGSGLSSVLHAIFCYAACCLAERFAVRRKASTAELDYADQPQSPRLTD